jgi:AraC-like DNA-binding protein
VQTWSTDDVRAGERFDYFAYALSSAIVPMRVDGGVAAPFEAHMHIADAGPVTVIHQAGTAHRSFRLPEDVSRSGEDSFHVILNRSGEWTIHHRGDALVGPGEALIVDSRYRHDLTIPESFDVVHLKVSPDWARRWMPRPEHVVGRPIGQGTTWGPAFSSFVSCLSPQLLVNSAVSAEVLIDQVGAMLALVAAEMGGCTGTSRDLAPLADRIHDCMAQRCGEPLLDAKVVAESLRLDEQTVHAALAARGKTFARILGDLRVDVAERMLQSGAFRDESVTTIAERAGFPNATALSRALQDRYGPMAGLLRMPDDRVATRTLPSRPAGARQRRRAPG